MVGSKSETSHELGTQDYRSRTVAEDAWCCFAEKVWNMVLKKIGEPIPAEMKKVEWAYVVSKKMTGQLNIIE